MPWGRQPGDLFQLEEPMVHPRSAGAFQVLNVVVCINLSTCS
jgi:hypothetical protein